MATVISSTKEHKQLERIKYFPKTNSRGPLRVSVTDGQSGERFVHDLIPGKVHKVEKCIADHLYNQMKRLETIARKSPDGSNLLTSTGELNDSRRPWSGEKGDDPGEWFYESPGGYHIDFMDR